MLLLEGAVVRLGPAPIRFDARMPSTMVTESLVPRKFVAKKPGEVPGMVLRIAAGVRPVGSASSISRV